jgi:hypothetical protein
VQSRSIRAFDYLPVWVAAASFLFTAAAYGWFHSTGTALLGMDASWLIAIVRVEFLAVHAFLFLMILAVRRPQLPQFQGLRCLGLGLLLFFYMTAAHSLASWQGVVLFASLGAATYLGFFVNLDEGIRKLPELGLRWICNLVLLILLARWFEMPSEVSTWDIGDGILSVGGLYFLGLTGLEVSGLYRKPFLLDIGRGIVGHTARAGSALSRHPELQATHGPLYWAVVPILGSAALNFLPLIFAGYVAGAGARLIDASIEWPRNAEIQQWWFPAILALILLPVRCYQFHLFTEGRVRSRILSILAALYLLVAAFRVREDPTYHFAYTLFPEDAYGGFLLLEVPLLLFLVPATWLVFAFPRVTRSTRTSASGS